MVVAMHGGRLANELDQRCLIKRADVCAAPTFKTLCFHSKWIAPCKPHQHWSSHLCLRPMTVAGALGCEPTKNRVMKHYENRTPPLSFIRAAREVGAVADCLLCAT